MDTLLQLHEVKKKTLEIEAVFINNEVTADSAISLETILTDLKDELKQAVNGVKLSLGHKEFIKKAKCTETIFYRRLKAGELTVNGSNHVLDIPENFEAVQTDKRKK